MENLLKISLQEFLKNLTSKMNEKEYLKTKWKIDWTSESMIIFKNSNKISFEAAKEWVFNDPDDSFEPNDLRESWYIETGDEKSFSLKSAKDYKLFFKEFVPNVKSPKHKYTVSIHPAVYTWESFEIYWKFKMCQFDHLRDRN